MRPSASAKIRSALTFSASRSQIASSSSWVTPSSTSIPGPLAPTTSPSTRTAARLTRCTSARIASDLAQLGGRLLGRHDVEVHAGAELEPGHVRQARDDVDAPAEVIGVERGGADPEVQRRDVAQLAPEAGQGFVQQGGARRPLVVEAGARYARGEHELERQAPAVGRHEHGLVVDRDDALAELDLLLDEVLQEVAAHRPLRIGAEA